MGENVNIRRAQIITLLTDFGVKDAYASAMKGVLLGICPTVTLVDISHTVIKHDVLDGAFTLSQASPYFPKGTIHLAVVDPGVGTGRRRIIIQGRHHLYIGPDNGVLSLAATKDGVVKIFEIRNEAFMLPNSSKTFEGRDVFAPVAAHLASGVNIDEFGSEVRNFSSISISEPTKKDRVFLGEVIHIDNFGNITTNIPENMLRDIPLRVLIEVTVGEASKTCSFYETYNEVPKGVALLTLGSSGFLEIAVNRGSAKTLFKAKVGNRVTINPF